MLDRALLLVSLLIVALAHNFALESVLEGVVSGLLGVGANVLQDLLVHPLESLLRQEVDSDVDPLGRDLDKATSLLAANKLVEDVLNIVARPAQLEAIASIGEVVLGQIALWCGPRCSLEVLQHGEGTDEAALLETLDVLVCQVGERWRPRQPARVQHGRGAIL